MMLRFDALREMDRLAEEASRMNRSVLAFDAVRSDDDVTIYFDVPGVTSDDLEVTVEKNELTISAERRWVDDDKTVISRERPQGTFTRRVMLNDALDVDQLEAELQDGVLIVRLPVSEKSKQRRIDVSQGTSRRAIETTGSEKTSSSRE